MSHHRRRLSDKILISHKQACDTGNLAVAEVLLRALEQDLTQIGGRRQERRSTTGTFEQAYDRHHRLTVAGH